MRSDVLKSMLHVIVVNFVNKPMAKYPNLADWPARVVQSEQMMNNLCCRKGWWTRS